MIPLDAGTDAAMHTALDAPLSQQAGAEVDGEAPGVQTTPKKGGALARLKGRMFARKSDAKTTATSHAPVHLSIGELGSGADEAAQVEMMSRLFAEVSAPSGEARDVREPKFVEPAATQPLGLEAAEPSPAPSPAAPKAAAAGSPPAEKKPRLKLLSFKKKAADDVKAAMPIAVIFGFLPNVREQDAREYALGFAAEFMQTHGMVYFEAFPYKEGFAFEVQQGGEGRAYLPEILRFFDTKGEFEAGESVSVIVDTATRKAEVYRTRDGLDFVLLPEGSPKEPTEWLKGSQTMTPTVNRKTGFFVTGAVTFATGFAAMMVGSMLTRYQPYEPPPVPTVEYVLLKDSPMGQWEAIESVPKNSYVKALRFRNGKWEAPEVVVDVEMMKLAEAASKPSPLLSPKEGAQVPATMPEGTPMSAAPSLPPVTTATAPVAKSAKEPQPTASKPTISKEKTK